MSVRRHRGKTIIDTRWPDGTRSRTVALDEEAAGNLDLRIRAAKLDGSWRELRDRLSPALDRYLIFKKYAKFYMREYVASHNRSRKYKRQRIRQLLKVFRHLRLDAIGPHHVSQFIRRRKKQGVSNSTINKDLHVLHHMFVWAAKQRIIKRNVFEWFDEIDKLEEIEVKRPRATDEVLDAIFAKLDKRVYPLFTFIRETGCRKQEAFGLRHSQVDFGRREVTFSGNTKSGKARPVPLTEDALTAIEAMPKAPDCPYVFYHPESLTRWHDCRKPWNCAKKAADEEAIENGKQAEHSWVIVKDMRTAYGIKLAEAGTPMHAIQKVLGHASVTTTERYYAKYAPESASEEVRRRLNLIKGGKDLGHKTGT
ncbi:MAG TPA: site-specific integrase [Acidobacteriota bacterium]|jgi:integrase